MREEEGEGGDRGSSKGRRRGAREVEQRQEKRRRTEEGEWRRERTEDGAEREYRRGRREKRGKGG